MPWTTACTQLGWILTSKQEDCCLKSAFLRTLEKWVSLCWGKAITFLSVPTFPVKSNKFPTDQRPKPDPRLVQITHLLPSVTQAAITLHHSCYSHCPERQPWFSQHKPFFTPVEQSSLGGSLCPRLHCCYAFLLRWTVSSEAKTNHLPFAAFVRFLITVEEKCPRRRGHSETAPGQLSETWALPGKPRSMASHLGESDL